MTQVVLHYAHTFEIFIFILTICCVQDIRGGGLGDIEIVLYTEVSLFCTQYKTLMN